MLNNLFQLREHVFTRPFLLGFTKGVALETGAPPETLAVNGSFFSVDILTGLLRQLGVGASLLGLYRDVFPDVKTREILAKLSELENAFNVICVRWSQSGPKHYTCLTQVHGTFFYCDSLRAAPHPHP
jgi:hypothetical protein